MGVLVNEISSLYNVYAEGQASVLDELPLQYADFSTWQRKWLQGRVLEEQLSYWRRQLSGAPEVTELPTDRPRPPARSYKGAAVLFDIPRIAAQGLADLSSSSGATLFMGLLAAFQLLLFKYSGSSDVVVGSPIANRNRWEIEGLIGFFVNTLAYRATLSRRQTFRQLLDQIRETTLEAYAHQDLPFERVVEELHPERNVSYNPLFQVAFALQNAPVEALELRGLILSPQPFTVSSTRFDLEFHLWDQPDRLRGFVIYAVDLFDAPTISRMTGHFRNVIRAVTADSALTLEQVEILDEAERRQLLTEWNDTYAPYPENRLVHDLVEDWSDRTPDSLSVSDAENQLSYARLNSAANQLARVLRTLGVGADSIVGVFMDRSVEWVSTLVGILKAGAGYVCFDPAYPKDRVSFMVEDCRAAVVAADHEHARLMQDSAATVVDIETIWKSASAYPDDNPENAAAHPSSVSYVVYTSGSTGKPKGIVTSHASLLNLVSWHREFCAVTERDRASQIARCGFDAAAWEIWPYLASGSSVFLVDENTRISPSELKRWLIRNDITIGWTPPALIEPIFQEGGLEELKMRIMFSGSDRLISRPPAGAGFSYGNAYGPSEATVIVTAGTVPSEGQRASAPHIGRPLANNSVFILDGNMQPEPAGVSGELCIAGSHVARGYLFRADLTAEKFAPCPFAGAGTRMYRTGDLARYRPDGNIEFLGRIDNQIKIRGFRIELGEIESALLESPLVQEAVALAMDDNGEKSIAAYVAPAAADSDSSHLETLERNHVSEWQTLYDQTYSQSGGSDPEFNIIGWNSSYTGEPIDKSEMREWRDSAVDAILARGPKQILEIGCGTGLLLLSIAPHSDEYWGTDFSSVSLEYLRGRLERLGAGADNVKLLQKGADDFGGIPENYFDAVILNSVIQYFPGFDYLSRVLSGAVNAVKPGGFVFVGDVRNLDLLEAFHTSILLGNTQPSLSIEDMRSSIRTSVVQEEELLVSPKFFPALLSSLPSIGGLEIQLKRGRRHNELTKYRYDAVLHVGPERYMSRIEARFDWQRDLMNPEKLRAVLAQGEHESLLVQDIPNSRVIGEIEAAGSIMAGFAQTVDDLIAPANTAASEAFDPEDICRIGEGLSYQARLYVSGSFDNAFFDVLFVKPDAAVGVRAGRNLHANAVLRRGDVSSLDHNLRSFLNLPLQDKIAGWLAPELRRFLSERLPEYMIPSAVVVVDSLPRNANGKVDRKRLPRPSSGIHGESSRAFAAPVTPEEELIAGVWRQLLGVERVGVTDNFFDIGGHSLRATQAVSAIRDIFKVEIPLVDFFADPTVSALAGKVAVARRAGIGVSLPKIEPAIRSDTAPLSLAQQRLWFIDQLAPGSPVYNVPLAVRIRGKVSVNVLEQAISEVVRRHETLRTVFIERRGPQQYIRPYSNVSLPIVDLSHLPHDALEAEARILASLERDRAFNLSRGPLARFSALRLETWHYAALITMHHIVSDGWSLTVFMDEVTNIYEAFASGLSSPLEEMEIQYADYCCWQREWIDGGILDRQTTFWKEGIGESPSVVEVPPDKPRPPVQSFAGASLPFAIPRNVTSSLNELARVNRATVFMVLLAAFQALLHRYTAEETIIVGTPIAGRNRAEIERLIGFFVNTLIMKADVSGRGTFRELVDQVREFALGAYSNQEVPFEKLVEELHPRRDMSRNPLFQIMFALQSTPSGEESRLGFQLRSQESDSSTARFDMEMQVFEFGRNLMGTITYSTDLYDEATIQRLLSHYVTLLDRAAKDPGRRIEDLPLMTETEESQAMSLWNGEQIRSRDLLIHQSTETQARLTPDAIAAVGRGRFCSYLALERSAEKLAHELRRRGMGIESRVGVFVSRGIEMAAVLLGILKSGAAYVTLDPAYPEERMSYIIRDSQLSLLVTERGLPGHRLKGVEAIFIEDVLGEDAPGKDAFCGGPAAGGAGFERRDRFDLDSGNLAYVIYTSGSTGVPKGVAIEHRSAAALLDWAGRVFSQYELSWVLAATSICFDLSIFEIFAPLSRGGTVIIAENAMEIRELAVKHFSTLINTVPSAMAEIIGEGEMPGAVVTVNLAGEPLSGELVREIYREPRVSKLYNLYGPTEDTTYSTFALIDRRGPDKPEVGRPISNTQAYVLQPGCNPVPPGIRGGIYLSGSGLARGYLGKPDLTASAFLPAPFRGFSGARMYCTGDMGRFREDGKLEFLGRVDHQVKIRGFRIELGEIEAVLRQHPAIQEAAAIAVQDPNPNLIAYVVCEEGRSISAGELKSFLAARLPSYMAPSATIVLSRMPVTPNGKLNRKALEEESKRRQDPSDYVAPRTKSEELISRIWEEMLDVKPIGVNHNFFDLGGHSLLAVRVLSRIREATGTAIQLAAIFRGPTVGELAQILDGKAPARAASTLVEIQPGTERPRLYLIPGIGGSIADFTNLARAIGGDQPIFGFSAADTKGLGLSIEEAAAVYVDELLSVQPAGPYVIGGWSFGAVAAFEMARQLRSRQKAISLLMLFDMVAPSSEGMKSILGDEHSRETQLIADLANEITRGAAGAYPEEIEGLSRQQMLDRIVGRIKSSNALPDDVPADALSDWLSGLADRYQMLNRYRGGRYTERIVLFRAKQLPAENPAFTARLASLGPAMGWDRFSDRRIEVHYVDGSHYTMLEPPFVDALGTRVRELIGSIGFS